MNKHDEIRKILHDTGFSFEDGSGRTALDMTDEEVDVWLAHFFKVMTDMSRQMVTVFQQITPIFLRASAQLEDLTRVLAEAKESDDLAG